MTTATEERVYVYWGVCCAPQGYKNMNSTMVWWHHGLINYTDTVAKCRHVKNWPLKWLCGRCLSEFIDRRYGQLCRYFLSSFVNCCPSNLLIWSNSSPPFPVWISIMNKSIQCVRGEWYGILGLKHINTCSKVPLKVNFLDDDILHCLLQYESDLSPYGGIRCRLAEIASPDAFSPPPV